MEAFRAIGTLLFFPEGGALTHHPQSRRWYPSRWSGSCALHELSSDSSPEGAGNAASGHRLCSRLYVLLHHQNSCFRFGNNSPPACKNLPPAAFAQLWVSLLLRHPFSFCEKKQKQERKDGEDKWRSTTWKRKL